MLNTPLLKTLGLLSFILIIQGCTPSKSLYHWGEYEPMIYDMYLNPGKADVETQILTLSELIEQAQSYGKKVPPGIYAHLGMAHAQSGNVDAALDAFNTEKAIYPESTVFLEGIIERSQLKTRVTADNPSESSIEESPMDSSNTSSKLSSTPSSKLSSVKVNNPEQQ